MPKETFYRLPDEKRERIMAACMYEINSLTPCIWFSTMPALLQTFVIFQSAAYINGVSRGIQTHTCMFYVVIAIYGSKTKAR